jgi:hypothetical protein
MHPHFPDSAFSLVLASVNAAHETAATISLHPSFLPKWTFEMIVVGKEKG